MDLIPTSAGPLRAVLVGLDTPSELGTGFSAGDSLDELALLADTWGAEVVGRVIQARDGPDPAWYVGRGKVRELADRVRECGATAVIADSELSPVQLRNLENELGAEGLDVRVADRTQVILEIFARRAHSREGKLEVDLAQAVYALPRLSGKGLVLSRLGGGIGTRGPGETRLEADRRRLRKRITDLKREIAEVGGQRQTQARLRREGLLPLVALVGYTNAGKSTLFNSLTGAGVLVEDKLFATLDPVVRRVTLPNKQKILLSDTVGFIRRLPHHLVAAFRATLEEVRWADVLVHVVDASDEAWPALAEAAGDVLVDIGVAAETPVVYGLNKADLVSGDKDGILSHPEARRLASRARVAALSALTGEGVEDLLAALAAELAGRRQVFSFTIPYDRSGLLADIHEQGRVLNEDYVAGGIRVEVEIETVTGRRLRAALDEGMRR